MATKQYSREQLEKVLTDKYQGKYVSVTYPGYTPIHGIVNRVAFFNGEVYISVATTLFTISLESIKDCVKIVRG